MSVIIDIAFTIVLLWCLFLLVSFIVLVIAGIISLVQMFMRGDE